MVNLATGAISDSTYRTIPDAPAFIGGARIGVLNGRIVLGAGPGSGSWQVLDFGTNDLAFQDFPFGPDFRGGIYVG
jgi:hypothetical protein